MENPKYLIIIALIDGQNFTVPDGAPDRIEATVFVEARFGNESILRSDPIKLQNSNPEFVTELAWQLDKKSLHQLRIERKSIKLQVFMQTKEKKRSIKRAQQSNHAQSNGYGSSSNDCNGEAHKVELIGYTILDLRSARPKEQTKFHWCPLLNPKFRKPSYSRPEIQLALTMSRLDEEENSNQDDSMNQFSSISTLPDGDNSLDLTNNENGDRNLHAPQENTPKDSGTSKQTSSDSTKLYTTCLDTSLVNNTANKQQIVYSDEIIDNDIIIRSKDGLVHIYDAKHPHKFTIDDCDEHYKLTLTIPFTTNMNNLEKDYHGKYHFSVSLFGVTLQTKQFEELCSVDHKVLTFEIKTTHAGVLATYFELKSNLDIKLHRSSSANGECIGIATIQLNQLCSLDTTCRSIEGIFALQSPNSDLESEYSSPVDNPSVGVSVVLERYELNQSNQERDDSHINGDNLMSTKQDYICDELEEFFKNGYDTNQLTFDDGNTTNHSLPNNHTYRIVSPKNEVKDNILVENNDMNGPSFEDHHYCFTIDLKEFSYTPSQRLIPTLRELVIRYSYPFFGYKDTITTDASIPINSTSSIIVSGFCEFNFATTYQPLMTALSELPLDLEILAADDIRLRQIDGDNNSERLVATCSVNLAQVLELDQSNIEQLSFEPVSKTTLVPIYALDGTEIGKLQISLCLKDLGRPAQKFVASVDNFALTSSLRDPSRDIPIDSLNLTIESRKVEDFILETRRSFDKWKEEALDKLTEEWRQRDNDRFKRLFQRVEAKEARRDQEFRRKIEDLGALERKFKNSLSCVESLEKMLVDSLEQLKNKREILEDRLEVVESKISQMTLCNDVITHNEVTTKSKTCASLDKNMIQPQRSLDDNLFETKQYTLSATSHSSLASSVRNGADKCGPRRSSLRTATGISSLSGSRAQIPIATRSTSLVRRPSEGSPTISRIVKRSSAVGTATVVNEINPRVRPKVSSTNDDRDKPANLRKAEIAKRSSKPIDRVTTERRTLNRF